MTSGANIGIFSLLLSRQTGPVGQVIAFEPSRATSASFSVIWRYAGAAPLALRAKSARKDREIP